MKQILYFLFIILILAGCNRKVSVQPVNIIPQPQNIEFTQGNINWNDISTIEVPEKFRDVTNTFIRELSAMKLHSPELSVTSSGSDKNIIKVIFSEGVPFEGYELNISPESIRIKVSAPNGCYYAFQSLKQLLPWGPVKGDILLPALNIKDEPRFRYRGMHIDVSRHFFTVQELKQFIDVISQYKINRFHIHLTDDQGWRIQIDKYPLLTERGAWRIYNNQDSVCLKKAKEDPTFEIPQDRFRVIDGKRMYGGFYTKAQMRDIIQYAAKKQIEIVPEIDVPGHFMAAIENYPFLSCTGKAGWGRLFSTPACLGKETTYTFIENVLGEIADLFPGEYVHIGGDEVNISSWKKCPRCQAVIRKKHLKNEHELQTNFNRHIEKFLHNKGKKLMGWDEIAEGGLTRDATMMWWRNWAPQTREIAANNGNDMIITPDFEYYFDFPYTSTPVSKVYNYEPVPESFTPEMAKYVIGVQANLWSEWIPNTKRLYYQALPRMLALAETGWTEKRNKDFDLFNEKLIEQYERFTAQRLFYHLPELKGIDDAVVFSDSATLNITIPLKDMKVFYTTDGTAPTPSSTKYNGPVTIDKSCTVRVRAYRGDVFSRIYRSKLDKQEPAEPVVISGVGPGILRKVYKHHFSSVTKIPGDVKPVKNSVVSNIELGEFDKKENFGMVFTGYFNATKDGTYSFYTISDDGDQLFIQDRLVVDNKGSNAARQRKGMIILKKGLHPVKLRYCQLGGGLKLEVWVKPPGEEKRRTTPDDWQTKNN